MKVRGTQPARGHEGNVHPATTEDSRSLHKCLATTNIIESPQGGVERRTHNVTRWRDADMVQRWVASAWLLTEKHFRRIDGHVIFGRWQPSSVERRRLHTTFKGESSVR